MFIGTYEHTIDDKGRLAIPSRFRARLVDGLIVTRSLDICLQIFPLDYWTALSGRISALSFMQEDARALRRFLFAHAVEAEPDRQGRIVIPQPLREYAGLSGEAAVVGLDTHIEVWAAARWQAEQSRIEQHRSRMAQQLTELGI
jgi:MraZ protein